MARGWNHLHSQVCRDFSQCHQPCRESLHRSLPCGLSFPTAWQPHFFKCQRRTPKANVPASNAKAHFTSQPQLFMTWTQKSLSVNFCSILFLLSKLGPWLRFKGRGIRYHLSMGKLQDSGKACGMGGIVAAVLWKYNLSQVATDISHMGPSLPYLCNVNGFSFGVCPWPLEGSVPLQTQGWGRVHPSLMRFLLKGFCRQLGGQNHDLFICNLPFTRRFWHRTGSRSGH